MTQEFKCELCHRTFEKEWSDEEAAKEYADAFGDPQPPDAAVVCDDCYERMKVKNFGQSPPWVEKQ